MKKLFKILVVIIFVVPLQRKTPSIFINNIKENINKDDCKEKLAWRFVSFSYSRLVYNL
nr:MAG TPA: hypothetical protein [Caudoviricetes sp.]